MADFAPRVAAGVRIRHFHLSSTGSPYALYNQSHIISQAIRSMAQLESFAFVHTSEEDLVTSSPYACALLPSDILVALAGRPHLRALYLCGVKLITQPSTGPEHVPMPRFGAGLEEVHLSAVHDSALRLIERSDGLRRVHAWRDFARAARIKLDEWWSDQTWQTVEEIDMTGWGGSQGTPMLEGWLKSLVVSRVRVRLAAVCPVG